MQSNLHQGKNVNKSKMDGIQLNEKIKVRENLFPVSLGGWLDYEKKSMIVKYFDVAWWINMINVCCKLVSNSLEWSNTIKL